MIAPFSRRPNDTRTVEDVSEENNVSAGAKLVQKLAAKGAIVLSIEKKNNKEGISPRVSELTVIDGIEEAPEEGALMGTGTTRMDGNVAVPGISSVFGRANEIYRRKVAEGVSVDTAGAAAASAANSVRHSRRPVQVSGGPLATLNNSLRAGGNAASDRRTTGPSSSVTSASSTRTFSSLTNQSRITQGAS